MKLHKWKDIDFRGRIERVEYEAPDYQGKTWTKYANVYLPYGYDEKKPYNILYLIHGGGGNADAWLDCSQIKNVFDQAFAEGLCDPFIAVFPCFYSWIPSQHRTRGIDAEAENKQVRNFQKELEECVIPAVERRFHTFAELNAEGGGHTLANDAQHERETLKGTLQRSRRHRAIGGFSMGGCTTWWAFTEHLDIFGTFLPLSGDCWAVAPKGGADYSKETAQLLADTVKKYGFDKDDFKLLIATGDKDIAVHNLTPQVEAMKQLTDVFDYRDEVGSGNMNYVIKEDAVHAYEEVYHHVWNYLPYIFE